MDERRLESLTLLANQIRRLTDFVQSAELSPEETLPTAADLARLLGVKDHDIVKKNLKYLKDFGLIRALGLNPKRYAFDSYAYAQLVQDNVEDETLKAILERLEGFSSKDKFTFD